VRNKQIENPRKPPLAIEAAVAENTDEYEKRILENVRK